MDEVWRDSFNFIAGKRQSRGRVHRGCGNSGNDYCLSFAARRKIGPWSTLYDPSRKTILAAGRYVQENLNVATQYTSWLTVGDVGSTGSIVPGTGAIVRTGLSKVAAYRDEDGVLHQCSAVCPHLGGIVEWNSNESTWDCPCHGSRFDKQGHLICGPANSDLETIPTPIEVDVAAAE